MESITNNYELIGFIVTAIIGGVTTLLLNRQKQTLKKKVSKLETDQGQDQSIIELTNTVKALTETVSLLANGIEKSNLKIGRLNAHIEELKSEVSALKRGVNRLDDVTQGGEKKRTLNRRIARIVERFIKDKQIINTEIAKLLTYAKTIGRDVFSSMIEKPLLQVDAETLFDSIIAKYDMINITSSIYTLKKVREFANDIRENIVAPEVTKFVDSFTSCQITTQDTGNIDNLHERFEDLAVKLITNITNQVYNLYNKLD